MHPVILALESSCDETATAIIKDGKVVNNIIASQPVHHAHGGVVPELASRAHQTNIVPVVHEAMVNAALEPSEIDAVAFTHGPGLMGSLMVGCAFAKGLSLALQVPLIAVNHMEAHVAAHFIEEPAPAFPFLCLTVSGGHTEIILVTDHLSYRRLGRTLDDAVGEAFDKSAKMLGLPYPGGPLIDKHAATGNAKRFPFPQTRVPGLDFSFSGIKTAFLYFLRDNSQKPNFISDNLNDICASLQTHLVDMLLEKLVMASAQYNIKRIGIAGGVAANSRLRSRLSELALQRDWSVFMPDFAYCTDNAAMIGIAAHYKFLAGEFCGLDVAPEPRLSIVS